MKIKGVVPVLHTPITHDDQIDFEGLGRLVDFLVNKDIGALWVLGTGGEDMSLTYSDRLEVVKHVIKVNKNRKPLLVGASFYSYKETLEFLNELNELEIHGTHYMPYHQLVSTDRIKWIYKSLAEKSKHPLWMYSSANWCQLITPKFVEEMKGTKNIVGIKYSTSNSQHMERVARLSDENFNVLSAVAATFYSSLLVGVDGATSSIASPLPEIMIDIYREYKLNNFNSALTKQRKLNDFLNTWPATLSKDNFLKGAEEKVILKYRNICEKNMTGYYRQASENEEDMIIKSLMKFYPEI